MFDVDGTHLVNGPETYPKYPGIDMILVGYGRTRMGNCSGPACVLNEGRKPIKVSKTCISFALTTPLYNRFEYQKIIFR